jgi:hypothetical protein
MLEIPVLEEIERDVRELSGLGQGEKKQAEQGGEQVAQAAVKGTEAVGLVLWAGFGAGAIVE